MRNIEDTASAITEDTPWMAEPSGDGFFRVVNSDLAVLAEKCAPEKARLFAAVPELLSACQRACGLLYRDKNGNEHLDLEDYEDAERACKAAVRQALGDVKSYRVILCEQVYHGVEVSAPSEEDAIEFAFRHSEHWRVEGEPSLEVDEVTECDDDAPVSSPNTPI